MKKYFKFLLIGLFVALFIGTFVFLWNKTKTESVTYEIVSPKIETIKKSITATGKIEPRDEVLIKPQISGIISKVHKKAGELVRKNEIIATVKVIPEMGQLNSA
ncbi:MAG: efflux transporter periplasmic adaptor subunit, partial [Bacteroidetes bacterium]|nr:efflux transporter periplasmic adaptor subunit [Bacteroidota bacterium]